MKKLFFLFFLVSISAFAHTEQLRIMTYNVPRSNDSIPPEGVNTYESRAQALARYINTVHPDVLGMQEPTWSDLWVFLKLIPGYSMLGIGRDDGIEKGQFTLILYRTDKFEVEHNGTYFLSKTPDVPASKDWGSACRRLATWGIFRDKQTQARFFYTNTHLDHISDSARTHQMEVIKQRMNIISAQYGTMPMMITGDFNVASTSSGAYINATKLLIPMNDAWVIAQKQEGLSYSWPSYNPNRKIDYIILSKDINVQTAYIGSSVTDSGTIISDHNPHWADISWNIRTADEWDKVIYDAQMALDSTKAFKQTFIPLITNATEGSSNCQLTYDSKEADNATKLNYLIDGNRSTYFRSSWSGDNPYNPHYFQVDLKKAYQYLHFKYARYAGTSSTATGNCWVDMMITGSNDNENWEYITEFSNISTEDKLQTFPTFAMYKPFRYLRFNTMQTPDMKIRHSNPQYVIGEFQLYADQLDEANSLCCTNAKIKTTSNQLQTILDEVREARAEGTLTAEDINNLSINLQMLRNTLYDNGKLRLLNHHIQLKTLPYALQIKPSEDVTTYTLVRMPKAGTFHLRKKNFFEAGEPFFILTGKADALDASCTETIDIDIESSDTLTTEAKTINGVHGVLSEVNPNKTLYYIAENTLRMARVSIPANTGYIIRTEVKDIGGLANIALSSTGITEITNLGDINDDAIINVGDLTILVSYIMNGTEGASTKAIEAADINGDGILNVGDITALVNMIME